MRNKRPQCLVRLTFIFTDNRWIIYLFFSPLEKGTVIDRLFFHEIVFMVKRFYPCHIDYFVWTLYICTPIPPMVRLQVGEQIKHEWLHILKARPLYNRVCLCCIFVPLHRGGGTYQYRYGYVYTLIWIFINLSRRGLLDICHSCLVARGRMDFFPPFVCTFISVYRKFQIVLLRIQILNIHSIKYLCVYINMFF